MGWIHDVPEADLYDHEGWTVACAADGTELLPPEGSGNTSWWCFNGEKGYPLARTVKAGCQCGWRAELYFPLDWDAEFEVTEGDESDEGPYHQWRAHIDMLLGGEMAMPKDIARALADIRNQLNDLVVLSPLTAAKAAKVMEASGSFWTGEAVKAAKAQGSSWTEVGKALGISKQAAHERFRSLGES